MQNQYKPPCLLYFGMAYYVTESLAESIFSMLDIFFAKTSIEFVKEDSAYKIEVSDRERSGGDSFTLEITINSKKEFVYARNVFDAYTSLVKPYLNKNRGIIKKHCSAMNRFLMITGFLNENVPGKSIHDTRDTFELTLNAPTLFLDLAARTVDASDKYKRPDSSNLQTLPFDQAQVGHFHKLNSFEHRSISVEFIHLDLNYFYNYFIPLIDELSSNNLSKILF
jgi:hypothetical protein